MRRYLLAPALLVLAICYCCSPCRADLPAARQAVREMKLDPAVRTAALDVLAGHCPQVSYATYCGLSFVLSEFVAPGRALSASEREEVAANLRVVERLASGRPR